VLKNKEALASGSDQPAYSFILTLQDLELLKAADGSLLTQFKDPKTGQQWQLLAPYMMDAGGAKSHDVSLTIEPTQIPSGEEQPQDREGFSSNTYQVTISPDLDWLTDPTRQFPIHIDPTVVKGDAPVATWTMDEGYGTTTYDNSGNSNDLTLTNATWERTSDRMTSLSTYIEFDGTGDYLSRAYDTDFDFGTNSFSVSGWYKHVSTAPASGTHTILARYATKGFALYMKTSGVVCFGIDDDATWTAKDEACSSASYADSTWHHLEAVKSGTSSITLYIDGVQVGQDASLAATGTMTDASALLYLGADHTPANAWVGFLDNFTIYNYARSAEQVKADAIGIIQTAASFGDQTKDTLTSGLAGWWKMCWPCKPLPTHWPKATCPRR